MIDELNPIDVNMCDICFLLDGDERLKPGIFCEQCNAFICEWCQPLRWRRFRAMVKRKFRSLMYTTSLLIILSICSHAQIYDLACPAGTSVLAQTSVPATGHLRAYLCVSPSGVVTSPVFGTVTGTGTNQQVTLWNGASSITGNNDYTWNDTTPGSGTAILNIGALGDNGQVFLFDSNEGKGQAPYYDTPACGSTLKQGLIAFWEASALVPSSPPICQWSGSLTTAATVNANGGITQPTVTTNTNCSSSASPAVCGSSVAGSILIPTGVTSSTLTVNTTSVTANSQIFFYPDDSLGTRLSVTCNSTLATLAGGSFISARVSGVSFTITFNGTIATNGVCGSYLIIN